MGRDPNEFTPHPVDQKTFLSVQSIISASTADQEISHRSFDVLGRKMQSLAYLMCLYVNRIFPTIYRICQDCGRDGQRNADKGCRISRKKRGKKDHICCRHRKILHEQNLSVGHRKIFHEQILSVEVHILNRILQLLPFSRACSMTHSQAVRCNHVVKVAIKLS